jgi:hypothetical protein
MRTIGRWMGYAVWPFCSSSFITFLELQIILGRHGSEALQFW